ncbi:radical SAM protein [Neptuniibacter sp.]|uniref:radical SAM protein n=1 Tax=Neptuniibacter sp. TaxID=1962643 RepID=UPI0026193F44|nr:radical SAM protein [Neptuniibacter sp.]MCP4596244.1 radical SAM protein [Neptuniibacter sp.]
MHFVFCQVSTNLINAELPDDIAAEYYRKQWDKPGYYKPEHFWEVPLWIAEICGSLKHTDLEYTTELCIITEHDQTLPDGDYYLFSVLDVNKAIVEGIATANPGKIFMCGGYVTNDLMSDPMNIFWYGSIETFIESFHYNYVYDLDYSLFSGMQTIPRLTMSTGCKHHCKFCTVPDELTTLSVCDIRKQIESFECLNFRYIYLNDKTFGQARNWRDLWVIRDVIKQNNPNFGGFIVQTTAAKCKNPAFVRSLVNSGVVIVELGVETYNDDILRAYNKPQNTDTIAQAIYNLYNAYMAIIPNIIIGLDGENTGTYRQTLEFLTQERHRFYMLNIYNLARYGEDGGDTNELTQTGNADDERFYNDVFRLGLEILRQ